MRKRDAPGKSDDTPARSGRRRPVKLAVSVDATARAVAAGRGFHLLSVASRWRDIVGEGLANHTQPLSIGQSRAGGILTMKADSGAALLVQHQQREIVARINSVLGEGAVVSLKFVQGIVERGRRVAPKPVVPRLTPDDESKVQASIAGVSDPELRERLARLMRRALGDIKRR